MGAKFIVDRRCAVKSSLTLTGLIEAIKHRGLLRRINEMAAAGALPACGAEDPIDLILPSDSPVPRLSVRELQRQQATLMEHNITCRQCPSSVTGHVGGCISYVPYPLSEGLEFLFWLTATQGLKGELPEQLTPPVVTFAEKAMARQQTPFSDGMRARGDLLGARPRIWQGGPVLRRKRLTSGQVMDAFFVNGVLGGDELQTHKGFLEAALAVSRALEPALKDEQRRVAMREDLEPYSRVLELMDLAQEQGLGVYLWP